MIVDRKIVVVTGDPTLAELIHRHLGEAAYQVVSTQGFDEELRSVLDSITPDLVVLDMEMPWMNGIELGLFLRQWSEVPVIMLSTWGAGKNEVRYLDMDADDYLTEPLGIAELMSSIDKVLRPEDVSHVPLPVPLPVPLMDLSPLSLTEVGTYTHKN